jgi:SET domain-containing protein
MKITDNKIGKYKLHVKRAVLGSGLGLFALEDIPKGHYVIEYFGRELSEAEQYTSKSKYLFEITKKITVDGNIPENIARYINHSCRPNCKAEIKKNRILINSIKNIKAGEQLSYDYGKEFWNEHIKPIGCKCNKCYKSEVVFDPAS